MFSFVGKRMRRPEYSLDIKNCVGGVHRRLVLGSFTNEALLLCKGHERGRGEASLLVGDCSKLSSVLKSRHIGLTGGLTDLDIGALIGGHA